MHGETLNKTPYSFSSTRCYYHKDKVAVTGNVPKPNDLSEIVDSQMQNYVHLFKTSDVEVTTILCSL